MSYQPSTNQRHNALLSVLGQDHWESVVARVLDQRGNLPTDARRKLETAINHVVRIRQFPKQPSIAPTPLLKGPVLGQLRRSEELANAILQSWFASQETLYAIVRNYLHSKEEEVDYPDFVSHEFQGILTQDDWASTCQALLQTHHEMDEGDLALMVCFAMNRAPSQPYPTQFRETEPEGPHIIEQVRQYLEQLPFDSDEWREYIPEFLTTATEIVDRKGDERQVAATLVALHSSIGQLEKYSEKLAYLELDTRSWLVSDDTPLEDVAKAFPLLSSFSSLLEDYELAPPVGSSISESQRLWEEQISLSRRIQQHKAELDFILISIVPPRVEHLTSDPEDKKEDQVGELVGDLQPGLSDLILSSGKLEFSPTTTDYSIEVEHSAMPLMLTPVLTHPDAAVTVIIETPDSGRLEVTDRENGTFKLQCLDPGQTTICIAISATSLAFPDKYRLTVKCVASDDPETPEKADASLKWLELSAGDLKFNQETTKYSVELPGDSDELLVEVKPTDELASVTLSAKLNDGATTRDIKREGTRFLIGRDILDAGEVTLLITVSAVDNETCRVYSVLLETAKTVDLPGLVWSLVSQDDLTGAYWLSKSMATQGLNVPVDPALLKAAQGARWLKPDSGDYIEDLFYIVGDTDVADDSDDQVLLRLAASLSPSLMIPETNMLGWLSSPRCLPIMDNIVFPMKEFAAMGYACLPEHVNGDEGFQSLEGRIADASDEARRWLGEAYNYQTNFRRAVIIWQYLCRDDLVGRMLTIVAEDDRSKAEIVRACVEEIRQGDYAAIFDRGYNATATRHSKPAQIVGGARDWLIKRLEEAKDRAEAWHKLVARAIENRSENSDQWLQERVSHLRQELRAHYLPVMEGLLELGEASNPPSIAGSAICAARSLEQLAAYLDLGMNPSSSLEQPSVVRDVTRVVESLRQRSIVEGTDSTLETAMAARLFWVDSLDLDDLGLPKSDHGLVFLSSGDPRLGLTDTPLEDAIRNRINNLQDYRFVDLMIGGLSGDEVERVNSLVSSAMVADGRTLQGDVEATRVTIEQAEKDGVIEFEGAAWDKHVATLNDIVVEEIKNFKAAFDSLDSIRSELDEEREKRRQELQSEWDDLLSFSDEGKQNVGSLFDHVNLTFRQASDSSTLDIRVMEDCVSRLRDLQAEDESLLPNISLERERTSSLEGFLSWSQEIKDPQAYTTDSGGLKRFRQELTRASSD